MFEYKAQVDKVVDGDTIDVTVDLGFKISTKQRIRLARIDTPERGKPGFQEATDRLATLVGGATVTLKTEKVSKWGYYLGNVFTEDGRDVNQTMIDEGLAAAYNGGTKATT